MLVLAVVSKSVLYMSCSKFEGLEKRYKVHLEWHIHIKHVQIFRNKCDIHMNTSSLLQTIPCFHMNVFFHCPPFPNITLVKQLSAKTQHFVLQLPAKHVSVHHTDGILNHNPPPRIFHDVYFGEVVVHIFSSLPGNFEILFSVIKSLKVQHVSCHLASQECLLSASWDT